MGREVRRVPADWEHPEDAEGAYVPLQSGDIVALQALWNRDAEQWARGLREHFTQPGTWVPIDEEFRGTAFETWDGTRPLAEDYMPQWTVEQRTHYQMYETTSGGTPISPVFATAEELARWLADTEASAVAEHTATYEQWLATIKAGYAADFVARTDGDGAGTLISGVATIKAGTLISGVAAVSSETILTDGMATAWLKEAMVSEAQTDQAREHGRVEDSAFVTVRREELREAFLEAGAENERVDEVISGLIASASRRRSAKPSDR